MKSKFLLLAAMLCVAPLLHAQGPTPVMVTPSPAAGLAGGLGTAASQSTTYHFLIPLSKIQGLGAATSGDILLFTTPPGKYSEIGSTYIGVPTTITGGGISAATVRVQTATNNYGSTVDAFTAVLTPSKNSASSTGTGSIEPAATAVNLHVTSTGGNLNAATTGVIDVWVTRLELTK